MAHIKDAVVWWNEKGRFYGAKAPEVRALQKLMQNVKRYLKLIQQKRFQNVVAHPLQKNTRMSMEKIQF